MHTQGPITVAPFKNNISRGWQLLVTDDGVPNCPIAQVASEADARLYAAAPHMLAVLKAIRAALTQKATFPADVTAVVKWTNDAIARAVAGEG